MEEKKICVSKLIDSPSALTREQGKKVYDYIVPIMENGEKIILDFDNIESIITPFLNVAIGKLYEKFNSDQLNSQLELVNYPEGSYAKFTMVISNAKKFYANKSDYNRIVKEVLEN